MHHDFWHQRWANNQIGFHESEVNRLLVAHFRSLSLVPGARVFVPLCGMSLDIDWLLSSGFQVVGVELSGLAVARLFQRLGAMPVITGAGTLECHSAPGLDVYVGDVLALTPELMGRVDAIYDRAALIALPPEMRKTYEDKLRELTGAVQQLVVTLEYDQSMVEGPPFSVSAAELASLHAPRRPVLLSSHEVPGGIKGKCAARENVWLV